MAIGLDQVFRRSNDFVFRCIEGEAILVPIRSGVGDLDCIYSLNAIGALVWERLDGKTAASEIGRAISAEYDVSAEQAEADLAEFLAEMKSIGAVAPANP